MDNLQHQTGKKYLQRHIFRNLQNYKSLKITSVIIIGTSSISNKCYVCFNEV